MVSTAKIAASCTVVRTSSSGSVRSKTATTATSDIACVLARTCPSTPRPASSRCPTTCSLTWCRSAASAKLRSRVGMISPPSVARTTVSVAPCATRYARGKRSFHICNLQRENHSSNFYPNKLIPPRISCEGVAGIGFLFQNI